MMFSLVITTNSITLMMFLLATTIISVALMVFSVIIAIILVVVMMFLLIITSISFVLTTILIVLMVFFLIIVCLLLFVMSNRHKYSYTFLARGFFCAANRSPISATIIFTLALLLADDFKESYTSDADPIASIPAAFMLSSIISASA